MTGRGNSRAWAGNHIWRLGGEHKEGWGHRQARILEWVAVSFSYKLKSLSPVRLFATSWTVVTEFSKPEYWSG